MVEHLVAGEEPLGVRPSPRLEEGFGARGQRLGVAPEVDRIVEHRLALRVALEEVNQRPGFDAVREDREEARESRAPRR